MTELPIIWFNGIKYIFDYRLNELRTGFLKSVHLSNTETELLAYAVDNRKEAPRLLKINMSELAWKL